MWTSGNRETEVAFATDDLDQAWDELDEKVEETVGQFPEGTMAPIINDEFGDVAVITLALQSADFPMDELGDLAEHVRDQLYTIPGTKRVDILGRPQERVYIEMSNAVLAQLGVPLDAVAAALAQQNVVAPGGAIETESRRLSIEPSGACEKKSTADPLGGFTRNPFPLNAFGKDVCPPSSGM